MDLRREFHKILENYGHDILLQRSSRYIRCSCWNCKYQEPLSSCPKCMGSGRVVRIERHRVRTETATNIITLPGRKQQTPIGQVSQQTRAFFMMHDVHPKVGDVIYEVGWDKDRPTNVLHAFEISYADEKRGKNGRIEFYQVSSKENNTTALDYDNILKRRIGGKINYEFS